MISEQKLTIFSRAMNINYFKKKHNYNKNKCIFVFIAHLDEMKWCESPVDV